MLTRKYFREERSQAFDKNTCLVFSIFDEALPFFEMTLYLKIWTICIIVDRNMSEWFYLKGDASNLLINSEKMTVKI